MKLPLLLSLLLLAGAVQADTRYVTDQLAVTLRSGESDKHRILRMLKSGSPVTVLSSNSETGYSKVRSDQGVEGYILTHQLETEPVARDKVAKLEQRLRELEAAPGELQGKLARLSQEYDTLRVEHDRLKGEKSQVEAELDELKRVSSEAVQMAEERRELRKQVAGMTREIEDQKQQIRELENSSTQRWFIIGGGVLLGGIVLGLVLPHLRFRRRRESWGSL